MNGLFRLVSNLFQPINFKNLGFLIDSRMSGSFLTYRFQNVMFN